MLDERLRVLAQCHAPGEGWRRASEDRVVDAPGQSSAVYHGTHPSQPSHVRVGGSTRVRKLRTRTRTGIDPYRSLRVPVHPEGATPSGTVRLPRGTLTRRLSTAFENGSAAHSTWKLSVISQRTSQYKWKNASMQMTGAKNVRNS